MRHWLTFNNIPSTDYGVYISGAGTFDAPARDEETVAVPGKNGDIVIDNGRYNNISVAYPAFIYRGFRLNVEGLRNFLLTQRGYKRLEDTYHPEYYRFARWSGEFTAEVEEDLAAGRFDLVFDCKPQRFLKSGEMIVTLTESGGLFNETPHEAKPLLRVYGTGRIAINGVAMTISEADEYTDIDCDIQDAYKGVTNCNGNISGSFPTLMPGRNSVTLDGVSRVDITPRWWVL